MCTHSYKTNNISVKTKPNSTREKGVQDRLNKRKMQFTARETILIETWINIIYTSHMRAWPGLEATWTRGKCKKLAIDEKNTHTLAKRKQHFFRAFVCGHVWWNSINWDTNRDGYNDSANSEKRALPMRGSLFSSRYISLTHWSVVYE